MRSPFRRLRLLASPPGTAARVESPSRSWMAACALVIAIIALVLTLLTPRTVAAPAPVAAPLTTTTTTTTAPATPVTTTATATLTTTPSVSAMPIAVRPDERLAASRALHHPSPAQAMRDLPSGTGIAPATGTRRYGPRLGATGSIGLHVAGNKLEDQNNAVVTLRGVDHAGSEYACVQGWGIFDGPTDIPSVQAMASWHADVVRVPLNEDCWLGINGYPKYGTASGYQQAIQGYVANLESQGFYVILDLHWNNGGTNGSTGQGYMVDADHGVAFWQSVAGLFGNDNRVIFDLYNEPTNFGSSTGNTWDCWKNGGSVCTGATYAIAGMQTVVTAIRNTGATNVLELNGLAYGNDVTQWATHAPTDPLHNLLAGVHLYTDNQAGQNYPQSGFHDSSGLNQDVNSNSLLANYPIIISELGESNCNRNLLDALYPTIEADGISWVNWSWNSAASCGGGPSVITNPNGSPTQLYGQGAHDNMVRYAVAPAQSTPVVPPTAAPTNTAAPQPSVSYTSASASPSTAAPGSQVTFTVNFTVSGMPLVNAPLRIKFKDGTGTTQGGDFGPNLSLPVGTYSQQVVGTLPGTAPVGNYTVEIGLFGNNANYSATLFYSIGQAGFTVAGAPVATATTQATNTPSAPTATPAPVVLPQGAFDLSTYYNHGAVTNDGGSTPNFDDYCCSYSAQALAAAGATPGGTVIFNGIRFAWPAPVNANGVNATQGQAIPAPANASSSTLAFLAAGRNPQLNQTGTISYTDGTAQTYAISVSDWSSASPVQGDQIALGTAYRNNGAGRDGIPANVYYTSVSIDARRTVQAVVMPNDGNLRIFAMSVGLANTSGAGAAGAFNLPFNFGDIVNDGSTFGGGFDRGGYAYSTQALAAAGLPGGGQATFGGATFNFPAVAPADGVIMQGQSVTLTTPIVGSALSLLGAGAGGGQSGTFTVGYTDGTTQQVSLAVGDWCSGTTGVIVTSAYRDTSTAGRDTTCAAKVMQASATLTGAAPVQSVTFPQSSGFHVFALSVVPVASPTGTTTPTNTTPPSTATPTPTNTPGATATPMNTPTATATATASGSPSVQIMASSALVQVVAPGATQTLHLTATSPGGVSGAYAQFLIYDPSHALVATVASGTAVTLTAGASATYTATWAVPASAAPGAYTVTPQVLSSAGGALISN